MSAEKLHHIGIAVESIDEALSFYEQALGAAASEKTEVPAEQVSIVTLPVGESRIELIEATSRNSPIARFVRRRGPGLHHIALEVGDIDAAVERLQASGGRLVFDDIRRSSEGYRYVFIHPASTGGLLLELIEEGPE